LIFRPFKAQPGDGEPERLIGLLKNSLRGRVRVGQRLAHASGLRALAGE